MSYYLFKSNRLGFRNWLPADIEPMAEINSDKEVMEFFPGLESKAQTTEFVEKMQRQQQEKGYCYFAVDQLENGRFIGFIGLSEKTFKADFTPCIDIGWRLDKAEWNKGYATEGAIRCLQYGFHNLFINKIVAIAPEVNSRSEQVMKKIGMKKVRTFNHPLLANHESLRKCLLYKIDSREYNELLL